MGDVFVFSKNVISARYSIINSPVIGFGLRDSRTACNFHNRERDKATLKPKQPIPSLFSTCHIFHNFASMEYLDMCIPNMHRTQPSAGKSSFSFRTRLFLSTLLRVYRQPIPSVITSHSDSRTGWHR